MDEPLSNLDAKLRMEMRAEIKRLHRESKATTVYVTHDQTEALTLSSRVAVMDQGVLSRSPRPGRSTGGRQTSSWPISSGVPRST